MPLLLPPGGGDVPATPPPQKVAIWVAQVLGFLPTLARRFATCFRGISPSRSSSSSAVYFGSKKERAEWMRYRGDSRRKRMQVSYIAKGKSDTVW